jgi:protein-arginine deiminase
MESITHRRPATRAVLTSLSLASLFLGAGCGQPNDQADAADADTGPIVGLVVDSNRDGTLDPATDREHRAEWSNTFGAMLLANLDDDDGNHMVDAVDDAVNGDADARDLAPVAVQAWARAPEGVTGRVAVDMASATRVRLFVRGTGAAGGWTRFDPANTTLTAEQIRAGVEFGIESKEFPGAEWNGRVELTLTVSAGDGAEIGTDRATMRVAPFILSNHMDAGERVYAAAAAGYRPSTLFHGDLSAALETDMMPYHQIDALDPEYIGGDRMGPDVWTQDVFDFGWTAIPGRNGMVQGMRVVLRSPTADRAATRVSEREILGPDVGYIWYHTVPQITRAGFDPSLDSFGNLESTPPYRRADGTNYPFGRVLIGRNNGRFGDPALLAFLNAQVAQGQVINPDTGFLLVGHVDEIMSFVPTTRSTRGWKFLVASPRLARTMLQEMVTRSAANADALMFRGMNFYVQDGGPNDGMAIPAQRTIGSILADAPLMAVNQRVQTGIDRIRMRLQTEMEFTDADVIEIPILFQEAFNGLNVAYMPGTVNLLSYGTTMVIPRPHGPTIDGVDAFEQDLQTRVAAPLGLTIHFTEEWDLLHAADGEVHCGTNTLRRIPATRWWENAQ